MDANPPNITIEPLPYEEALDARPRSSIQGVVIHCTETPDLETAREFGERVLYTSGTGNSGHYYIDLDGSIHQFVDIERVAHHVRGYNQQTIGIELVNPGRFPRWYDHDHQSMVHPYPQAQIDALMDLLARLRHELPDLAWIAGHEDLDTEQVPAANNPKQLIYRKRDPGPLFPWPRVIEAGWTRLGD
ncbi:N-acetylmuramoyl-L-alanine amidase [Pseudomarimonas arenosa]